MALRIQSQFKTQILIDGETINIRVKRFSPDDAMWFNAQFGRLGAYATGQRTDKEKEPEPDEYKQFVIDAFTRFVTLEPEQIYVDDSQTSLVKGAEFVQQFGARDDVIGDVLMNIFMENRLSAEQKANWRRRLAPFVPTPVDVAERMMQLAEVSSADTVVDLGCGSGRLVVAAAKRGAKAIGYDNDSERITEAEAYAKAEGVEHLCTFHHKDALEATLTDATVVAIYLLAGANAKLRPVFQQQLPRGARVISHAFTMGGTWVPKLSEFVTPPEGEALAHSGARWVYLYEVDRFRGDVH